MKILHSLRLITITAITLFLTTQVWAANPIDDKCGQFTPYGAPDIKRVNIQFLCRTNYAVSYDNNVKVPAYVLEHVTKAAITGPTKRKDSFRPDPEVAAPATLADYASAGSVYDRGHLSPAGDNTQTDKIMYESFLLSNMMPQAFNNNRGIWKQLETKVRDYVLKTGDVYVASGTIYDAGFKKIGNGVGVPTRIFKVVIDVNNNKASAYIFPNTALPVADMEKYKVTIADVEKATGINFNPKLTNTSIETVKTW